MAFFQETQERVRNSHGKRAISVRAIEVLLFLLLCVKISWSCIVHSQRLATVEETHQCVYKRRLINVHAFPKIDSLLGRTE